MRYGYEVSSGGPGGPNFWKMIGGAPSNIDINSAVGVSGINAMLPSDTKISLRLATIATGGSPEEIAGGFYYDPAVKLSFTGVVKDILSSAISNVMSFINLVTNKQTDVVVTDQLIRAQVKDTTTGQATSIVLNQISIGQQVGDALGNNYLFQNDPTGIYYQVNGAVKFQIKGNGIIQTNQASAGAPVGAATKKIPVYDIAGTLQGYIPLFN